LGAGITPLQAGLDWVVAFGKPQFSGKAALVAERDGGVSRHLRGITTEGRRPPRADCSVMLDGEAIGMTTSGNFSPILGHGIALAFLPPGIDNHTAVSVDLRGTSLAGAVTGTPFVRRGQST
jgi:aminomethyltransferase